MATIETIANAPLPALPACDEEHFAQCLGIMDAALPRQSADEINGKLRLAAYRRKLGHLPKEQINYLADQALERCKWFPTIAECLTLAAEWQRGDAPVQVKARAEALARKERQARLDDARKALRRGALSQDGIDVLPDRTKQILETEGLLYRCPDGCGTYTARPVDRPEADDELGAALDRLGEQFPSKRQEAQAA